MRTGSLTSPSRRRRRQGSVSSRSPRRWRASQVLVVCTAVLGAAVMVYPAAAWFSAIVHHGQVDGYVRAVQAQPNEAMQALLEQARQYNAMLPDGPIRDPYVLTVDGQQTAVGEGSDAYFERLVMEGTDAMARIRIPTIGVDLPVYHGTDPVTLSRGIGHMFGSALPVGGRGSHAVLTGHSGFAQAVFFDEIRNLELGDSIIIQAAGENLHYEVDQIVTVLPTETEYLRKVPGHDYLTLITCTPTGVNSHRLLVRAERVEAPGGAAEVEYAIEDTTESAGYPMVGDRAGRRALVHGAARAPGTLERPSCEAA